MQPGNDEQTKMQIDLWKYFTDDAAAIKDRMWTICSWMFSLQAGLVAFVANYFEAGKKVAFTINNPSMVLAGGVTGLFLSVYTLLMIQQYGRHIRSMWNRADFVRRQVPGLSEIWFLDQKDQISNDEKLSGNELKALPKVALRLAVFALALSLLFMLVVLSVLL